MADQHDSDGHPPSGDLFSTIAADYAEVVPGEPPKGPESLWATESFTQNDPEDDAAPFGHERWSTADGRPWSDPWSTVPDPLTDEATSNGTYRTVDPTRSRADGPGAAADSGPSFGVGDHGGNGSDSSSAPPPPSPPPGDGSFFTADPVGRDDGVIDEDLDTVEVLDQEAAWERMGAAPGAAEGVFSSGSARAWPTAPPEPPPEPPRQRPEARHTQPPPWSHESVHPPHYRPPPSGSDHVDRQRDTDDGFVEFGDHATAAPAPDPHGYDRAITRLDRHAADHARVPLAVCGALLLPGEQVLGVVTGQMLGRTAAVVVTNSRVVVANDRRWQPIVDIYRIDQRLTVRGRHDRQIAALSFADDERLSMVDGITEVEIAIGLVEAIRNPGAADHGAASEF